MWKGGRPGRVTWRQTRDTGLRSSTSVLGVSAIIEGRALPFPPPGRAGSVPAMGALW